MIDRLPVPDEVVTGELFTWSQIATSTKWTGLLIGNGASCAIADSFRYSSLRERATAGIPHPLTDADKALFAEFDTDSFEDVLAALWISTRTARVLSLGRLTLVRRYLHVRRSLIEAVQRIHLAWSEELRDKALRPRRLYLRSLDSVYSTNYDLLLYWTIMSGVGVAPGFVDFFWSNPPAFNPSDTGIGWWNAGATKVYYLHGGLHLFRNRSGFSRKQVASVGSLLDRVGRPFAPLYVAEGASARKLRAILRSDYLHFALDRFRTHAGALVVFGHSLQEQSDGHLVAAMQSWTRRQVAISVVGSLTDDQRRAEKLRIMRLFPRLVLQFYDASTHPLGAPWV